MTQLHEHRKPFLHQSEE